MWRLNWIHPFIDGNGRTTRAVSYYVLCVKLGFRIPGVKTIPQMVAENKNPYYKSLEAADGAEGKGDLDVSGMNVLLKDLLAAQMLEAIERADSISTSPARSAGGTMPKPPSRQGTSRDGAEALFSVKAGATFGAVALLFFMVLVLLQVFGHKVPEEAKYLIVIVLALAGGLSAAFLGGHASARGSVPLPKAQQHPVRYAVTGGIAVVIILLILGKLLFL
jgi:hypothetical protein